MINVLIIFGTRPEAIKMAPVVKTLQKNNNIFDVKVCVTAQHRDLLDQVLEIFQIKPDYDLNIMKSGQDLYDITSRVLLELRSVLILLLLWPHRLQHFMLKYRFAMWRLVCALIIFIVLGQKKLIDR